MFPYFLQSLCLPPVCPPIGKLGDTIAQAILYLLLGAVHVGFISSEQSVINMGFPPTHAVT